MAGKRALSLLFAIVSLFCAHGFVVQRMFGSKCGAKLHTDQLSMSLTPITPKSRVTNSFEQNTKRIGLTFTFITALTVKSSTVRAKTATLDDFLNSLATMILAKQVMEPTKAYVERQAYDAARSNIKYILNDLQLQKQVLNLVQNSIDFVDDMDAIDAAQEAGNRIANTAIQYDSTVYTCVFIPSDDGTVPPSAEKYRKQAYNFYAAFNGDIDTLLKLANEEQLQKAQEIASRKAKDLPSVLFKDTNNLRTTGI